MAKKKHTLGKFLALTTTAAAIGGACYVFRDQIKQSTIYKKSTECFSKLFGKVSDKFCQDEDDFFFDDEEDDDTAFNDVFSEDAKKNREYTSITINQKEEENAEDTSSDEEEETTADTSTGEESETTADTSTGEESETIADTSTNEESETTADTSTGEESETIADTSADEENEAAVDISAEAEEDIKEIFSDDSIPTITFGDNLKASGSSEESGKVTAYENEGLSDVSEDPDVLEEQDKLDY